MHRFIVLANSRTTFEMVDASGHSAVPLSGRARDDCVDLIRLRWFCQPASKLCSMVEP